MGNLEAAVDIIRTSDTLRSNIKTSVKESLDYYKLKKHEPCFDKGFLKLLDRSQKNAVIVSQISKHRAESLVYDPSPFEFLGIASDNIPAKLIPEHS
jgi:hypothetical protein